MDTKVLKTTSEVCDYLNITPDKIKAYKEEGLFNKEIRGKGYTEKDIEVLKQLSMFTKAGLTLKDIKCFKRGNQTFTEVLKNRKRKLEESIKSKQNALMLENEWLKMNYDSENIPVQYYFTEIRSKEIAGEKFNDDIYEDFELDTVKKIQCKKCGEIDFVDLSDYIVSESSSESENGMGPDYVMYIDSECNYRCPCCDTIIRINGWIREYPLGAYDSESIEVNCSEEYEDEN